MFASDTDWSLFYNRLLARTGIDLSLYKAEQLQRRILTMVEQSGCADLSGFWLHLSDTPDGFNTFLDRMAINVSEDFPEPGEMGGAPSEHTA